MEAACRGTCRDHASDIEEKDGAVFYCNDVIEERSALRRYIRLSEDLTFADVSKNAPVAPVVISLDMQTAFREDKYIAEMLSLTQYIFALFIPVEPGSQTGQHRTDILIAHARKELGPFQYRNEFFHEYSFPLFLQPICLFYCTTIRSHEKESLTRKIAYETQNNKYR